MDRQEKILKYWLGKSMKQQFAKNKRVDTYMRKEFSKDIAKAMQGKYDSWKKTPLGSLALIVLLDQFTRNAFRDTPKAFAQDKKALSVTLWMIKKEFDKEIPLKNRMWVYMPLMHSESLKYQNLSVKIFNNFVKLQGQKGKHAYAIAHRDIVKKFGRFPHRNEILGRKSTKKEIAFLKQPGSSF